MNTLTNSEVLSSVLVRYGIHIDDATVTPHGNGHINLTYLVSQGGVKYILQRINKTVFRDPVSLMNNILLVTDYLDERAEDPRSVMKVYLADDGKPYVEDDAGEYWRLVRFVEDAICLESPETEEDFYQSAIAFGKFQYNLKDFPSHTLVETIPDFHNTEKRFETFLRAVAEDKVGRCKTVGEEIAFYLENADFYGVLARAHEEGILPLRVTHNDTKINNVMLDASTRTALCVIDLDTIMPGFSVTDFGDSIRFGANTAAEDERDLSKVELDLGLFETYARGYLLGCGGGLSDEEAMLMPEGAKMMTLECGMRFLTDYLSGDTYFRTAYPEHNLVRARTQIKLARRMSEEFETMKKIIRNILEENK